MKKLKRWPPLPYQIILLWILSSSLSFGAPTNQNLTLPLRQSDWIILPYRKIPPNQISFADGALSVEVKRSAGPVVHKLDRPSKLRSLSMKGKVVGKKLPETGSFDEDSALRLGLVAVGKRTLSGPQKWFAADWVKKLFKLVPADSGLDKIYFFNLTDREALVGKHRVHPKSDLIVENIVATADSSGGFDFTKQLDNPIETAAIWLSIDGDDTKSEFISTISEITLGLAE
jgi:hypothetical protein